MSIKLPTLVATSVVRGSHQGESHGGIYLIDFETHTGKQVVDWNTTSIDFAGRGADRGLRGIAFNGADIYVAASDELFTYNQKFEEQDSYRNRYLKHCHEICRKKHHIFLTSTGFDSLLAFNLESMTFDWGFRLQRTGGKWGGYTFDPRKNTGPAVSNDFHINMVHVNDDGIFFSGLKTGALLHLNRDFKVSEVCNLPSGTHNARPWQNGVLFNDTASDCVRLVRRDGPEKAFKIVSYDESEIQFSGVDDNKIARQGFGRGLAVYEARFVIGGSSPSTVTLYDFESNQTVASVNMTKDIRNAIHGLEVWPF
jgi:hypothetical protein